MAREDLAQTRLIGDVGDDHGLEVLPAGGGEEGRHILRMQHDSHPLLGLGQGDLGTIEPVVLERHAIEVQVNAGVASRHLGERGGEASGAAVLEAEAEVALDELLRHLDECLAAERVADLHGWTPVVGACKILAREHRCAADAVASSGRAVEHEQVAGAGRKMRVKPDTLGGREFVVAELAEAFLHPRMLGRGHWGHDGEYPGRSLPCSARCGAPDRNRTCI